MTVLRSSCRSSCRPACRSGAARAHLGGRWNSRPLPYRSAEPRSERGSAAVELVLLAPVLVVLMLFVVYLGRLSQADARVRHAADQAARAASLVSRGRASAVASSTALDELGAGGLVCASVSVSSSPSRSAGIETIEVTVSCTVDGADLAPLAPGQRTVSATSAEVIDVIRAVDR